MELIHIQTEDSFFYEMTIHVSLTMFTNEPRMVNKFWAYSAISFEHKYCWCLFSKPHQSNIGFTLRWVIELGPFTLYEILFLGTSHMNHRHTVLSSYKILKLNTFNLESWSSWGFFNIIILWMWFRNNLQ
jgi:hypothetical protein